MFSYFNTFACISYVSFAGWTAAKSAATQLQASTCSKAWLIFFAPRHVRQEDVAWIPWIGGFGYVWMLQENPNCIDNLTSGTRRFCQKVGHSFFAWKWDLSPANWCRAVMWLQPENCNNSCHGNVTSYRMNASLHYSRQSSYFKVSAIALVIAAGHGTIGPSFSGRKVKRIQHVHSEFFGCIIAELSCCHWCMALKWRHAP